MSLSEHGDCRSTHYVQDNFEYCDPKHQYYLDGGRIPSATEILRICGVINYGDGNMAALHKGKAVHKACELLAEGTLDRNTLDPRIAGYVNAYERFITDEGVKIIEFEKPLYNAGLLYGVTPDQIGHIRGDLGIAELKTGTMQPWTALQTALQAMARWPTEYYTVKRVGVELHADGTYKLDPYTDLGDFKTAMGMVATAQWKLKHT